MSEIENEQNQQLLSEIKEDLLGLSIEMSALLWEYMIQGIINKEEYEKMVKVKQDFIRNH